MHKQTNQVNFCLAYMLLCDAWSVTAVTVWVAKSTGSGYDEHRDRRGMKPEQMAMSFTYNTTQLQTPLSNNKKSRVQQVTPSAPAAFLSTRDMWQDRDVVKS